MTTTPASKCRAKYKPLCRTHGSIPAMEAAKASGDMDAYNQARKEYDQAATQKAMDALKTEDNKGAAFKKPVNIDPAAVTDQLREELVRNHNLQFDIIDHELDAIKKWEKPWTKEETENLTKVQAIAAIVKREPFTEEDEAEVEQIITSLHPTVVPQNRRGSWSSKDPDANNWRARDKAIHDLARNLLRRRHADDLVYEPAEDTDNPALLGLREAQNASFAQYNRPAYSHLKEQKPTLGNVELHLQEAITRVRRGDQPAPEHILKGGDQTTLLPPAERVFNVLHPDSPIYYQQAYLATVFPVNELKEEMERTGIQNISVTPFYNTREWGNAYTVITPDGGTRTFSVYEHRNTDSIIINGKENWDGNDIPYAADSKNAFYAEFAPDDRKRAAQALTFYMMEAQSGDLNSDNELVANASHRDWGAILSATLPGFAEWHQKRTGEAPTTAGQETEDDILNRLDF